MKILDRYLVKQFLQTLLFSLLAFILIFVVIDMMENLDDFIDQKINGTLILQYYLVFMPEIIRLILPVSVLLSCLFTSGKMATLNEITAIKAGGISLYRYMAPFLITATLISFLTIYFSGYVVPMANKHRVYIEQNFMKKGLVRFGSYVFFQDSPNRIVTITYYDVVMAQANQVSIQEFNPKDRTRLISRSDAFKMCYDEKKHTWQLFNGVTRNFTDGAETMQEFIIKDYPNLNFKPEDVIKKQQKPEEMTLSELKSFSDEQSRTGNDPTRSQIAYQARIAFSFASIIVVLFGLPFSANKRKSGLAVQIGINMITTFVYLVFMKTFQAFGENGAMNPFLTAWLPNFIFLGAAAVNIQQSSK